MSDEKPPAQQAIKEDNLKRIFLELHRRGEMTRVQISRSTGLSAATVSALVDELLRLGLFFETGPAKTDHIGRKPINLRIRPDSRQLPVFSLTRWGALLTVYDLNLNSLETLFVPHASDQYGGFEGDDPESDGNPDTGSDYACLMRSALEKSRLFDPERAIAVCIASPGIFVQEKDAYSLSALHVSFSREVMAEFEKEIKVPLFFGNSSMAHAYAEKKALDALGETVNDLMYIYVRDGVGAGILCGGDLFLGAEETAGEIGHVTINAEGKRCVCGNRGCLEQYVNVDTILERARRASSDGGANGPATLESIGAAYEAGNAAVVRVVDDIAEKLFRGIYSAICLTGIKRIVIGGGIEQLGQGFLEKLRSFTGENGGRMLMRNVTIDYTRSGPSGDAQGIASYFLDKVYTIAMCCRSENSPDGPLT
jgi:predicted NBD/HSP70 family sugar kinase